MKKILCIILAVLMIMPSLASISQAADKVVLEDIVVGINEHYIGADYEDKIATAFEKYMANAGYTCKIEYRTLGDSSTTAAQLGSLINSAGDIDIVIGAGANIETTAGVEVIVKALHKSTYNSDGKRYGALLTDKMAAGLLYYFLTGDCNHYYSSVSDKTCDFCGSARAVSKLESIVVGVNERYIGAGYEDKIATAFETYMANAGYSCKIEYRTLGDSSTTAAQLGSLIKSAGDIDIVIGAGANIETTAGVDIIKKELHKSTYNSDGKRYGALLTNKTAAGLLYGFLTGSSDERQEVVVGVNARRIGSGYVDKIKTDFEEYMAEMGLEISVVFRNLGNSTTTAAQLGTLVKEAGDIDVLIGAGSNVDSSTGSALTIYEKAYHVPHYNADGSRYAARLTNSEAANVFYDFVTGACKTSPNRSKTKTLNILFIGNSFTYYNDMPDVYFANICKEGGYKVNVTRITKGSHFLYKFADPNDTYGAKVKSALENNKYDIVIIQEQSSGTITNPERFKKSVRTLAAMVKENGAELYLYSTWGYNEGYSKLADCGGTTAAMEKKVRAAYESIAKEVGAKVVYAGVAMLDIYKNTSINVYASDLYHPSENGSLLVAYTFYATLFGEDPRAMTYTAGLAKNDVVKLRKAAFEAAFYIP